MFCYSDGCDKDKSDENYHPKFNLQRFSKEFRKILAGFRCNLKHLVSANSLIKRLIEPLEASISKNDDAGSSVEAFGSEEALAHESALDISEGT